jgi:hypothetical protein
MAAELPGIGKVLAERIAENRPYQSVQDLLMVQGISTTKLREVEHLVTVGRRGRSTAAGRGKQSEFVWTKLTQKSKIQPQALVTRTKQATMNATAATLRVTTGPTKATTAIKLGSSPSRKVTPKLPRQF